MKQKKILANLVNSTTELASCKTKGMYFLEFDNVLLLKKKKRVKFYSVFKLASFHTKTMLPLLSINAL